MAGIDGTAGTAAEDAAGAASPQTKVAGLATALVIVAIYNLIMINKFFPLTEGWFSVYADRILHGKVPYRDFYYVLPPLYILQFAAMIKLFGGGFLPLRILGFLLMLGTTGVLYGIYSRISSGPVACLASAFATLMIQSCVAHYTYDFNPFYMFYGVAAAFLLLKACESEDFAEVARPGRHALAWLAGSGVVAGFCFLTKQSSGLMIAAALGMAVVCVSLGLGLRRAIGNAAAYSLGFATPLAATLGWLLFEGALVPFLNQVFLGASQSKGGLRTILFGWIGITVEWMRMRLGLQLSAILGLIVLAGWFQTWVAGRLRPDVARHRGRRGEALPLELLGLLAASIMAIGIPYILPVLAEPIRLSSRLALFQSIAMPWIVVVLTLGGFFVSVALSLTRLGLGVRARTWQILIWTSLGFVFGAGTSSPDINQRGFFFGVGLILACLLGAFPSPRNVARLAFAGLALLIITNICSVKYRVPYAWWGYAVEDIRESVHSPNILDSSGKGQLPQLSGFRLPNSEIDVLTGVKSIIQRNAGPGDPVFAFPHIPIFYYLSDRWPDTFALVHWFDVAPDSVVAEDMKRLERNPPKVIVVLDLPADCWSAHEQAFRGGRKAMQREMDLLLKRMTSEPGAYTLEANYEIPEGRTLKVWSRSGQGTSRDSATASSAAQPKIGSRPAAVPPETRTSESTADLTPP